MKKHTVEQGECIGSIAHEYGLAPMKVWQDPANAALRKKRRSPSALMPGDIVSIPDKRPKQAEGATEQRHRFVRKGVPSKIRLLILQDDRPRANLGYSLTVDHRTYRGRTDEDGRLEQAIAPNARRGKLVLETGEQYELDLGHIDPVDEMTGIQARLANLGYYAGEIDGVFGPSTREALERFQERHGLKKTGEPDAATLEKLAQEHDSAQIESAPPAEAGSEWLLFEGNAAASPPAAAPAKTGEQSLPDEESLWESVEETDFEVPSEEIEGEE